MDRIDPLIESAASRVRQLEPATVAVLVYGSFARGTAEESSDLDLRGLTSAEPHSSYRTWFQQRPGSAALHVSVGVEELEAWIARRAEPDWWTFGFPARQVTRYVWADDAARDRLGADPTYTIPAGEPELEDFVEFVGKVQRSSRRGDAIGARLFAQGVGLLAPRLLRPLNVEIVVHDRREALAAALAFAVAPDHYRSDLSVVLGLVEADDAAVADATERLARELLAFLRERAPDVDPQPEVGRYLADGTLERHLGFLD